MAQLNGLGIRRLRSLYDLSPSIELRPITILLGKNSVGKSSFARLFPLLRQSVERRKRSPILWFGDLVDYGSLTQAITRGSTSLELIFELNLADEDALRRRKFAANTLRGYLTRRDQNEIRVDSVKVTLTLQNDPNIESAQASKVQIEIAGMVIVLTISASNIIEKVTIDGQNFSQGSTIIGATQGQLLPGLLFVKPDPENPNELISARNPWRSALLSKIRAQLHGNTSDDTVSEIASRLRVTDRKDLVDAICDIQGPQAWEALKPSLSENNWFVKQLAPVLVAANLDQIIDMLDEAIANIFTRVRYLKPLRATAERYYRRLDLAVAEIDPEGRNFPMFLDSLSKKELASFRQWTQKYLSIDVIPNREGAQLTVMATNSGDSTPTNIADMGFGISQVLPIAAQLWSSSQSANRIATASFIVIEQPELHLHPEYQARLGDVFAGFARSSTNSSGSDKLFTSNGTKLIVETHSQHLVNRIGALIESKVINPEDVSIVLFEPDDEKPGTTKCRISHFNSEGTLTNWPYGFFDPEF
jgi:predicted ATPase